MPSTPIWTGASSTAFATGGNWSTASAPVTGDTAVFDFNSTRNIAGVDESAVTLAALYIKSTVPTANSVGDQATALKIGATLVRIGDPSLGPIAGGFCGRINLDLASTAASIVVVGTGQNSTDTSQEPVRIKGVNSSNVLNVQAGLVGVATNAPGDTATFGSINGLGGTINIGSGVTLTTMVQTAGIVYMNCAATTARQIGGTLTTNGTGAITSVYVGGKSTLNSSGTITTLQVIDGGTADFNQDFTPRTVTTLQLYKGATLNIGAHVTVTNPIQLVECGAADVTINVRPNVSLVLAYL